MAATGAINLDQMQAQMNEMLKVQMEASLIQNEFAQKSSIVKGTAETKQSMARSAALQH